MLRFNARRVDTSVDYFSDFKQYEYFCGFFFFFFIENIVSVVLSTLHEDTNAGGVETIRSKCAFVLETDNRKSVYAFRA